MKPNTVKLKEFYGGSMYEHYRLQKDPQDPVFYISDLMGNKVGEVIGNVVQTDREDDVRLTWYENGQLSRNPAPEGSSGRDGVQG